MKSFNLSKHIALIINAALISTASSNLIADSTLSFSNINAANQRSDTQYFYVKDGKLTISHNNLLDKTKSAKPKMIFDSRTNQMIAIDHRSKTFTIIDDKTMENTQKHITSVMSDIEKQMNARMANLPPEQQARMREVMAKMGKNAITNQIKNKFSGEPKLEIKKTKRTDKVGEIKCEITEAFKSGLKDSENCLTNYSALNISKSDFDTIRAFFEFQENMSRKLTKNNAVFNFSMIKDGHVPVRVTSYKNGKVTNTSTISKNNNTALPAAAFNVPKDYKERTLAGEVTDKVKMHSNPHPSVTE